MFNSQKLIRRISPYFIKQCEHYGPSIWASSPSLSNFPSNSRLLYTLMINGPATVHSLPTTVCYQPCREYAARKGTRARKAGKKVKKVEVKQPYVFRQLRKLADLPYEVSRPIDDSHMPLPIDDVYFFKRFRSHHYDFEEAVQYLRETHHPTVYNVPKAPLYLRVNLDMKYPNRATKCMDGWRSVIEMKQPFLLDGMTQPSVLAFCIEDIDYIDNVKKEGGADLAGGKEIIKAIQTGELNADDFEYLVAHPLVVPDLTAIRGLIKKKFPNVKSRTISADLVPEVRRLKAGIKIHVVKNDREPDFAYIETPIGTLDMENLKENFESVIRDTLPRRVTGKTPENFVISCVLKTPGHGFEEFKVDISNIIQKMEMEKQKRAAEDD